MRSSDPEYGVVNQIEITLSDVEGISSKDRPGTANKILNFPRVPTNRNRIVTFRSELKRCVRPLFRKGEDRVRACKFLDLVFKWEPEDNILFTVHDGLDKMDMLVSADLAKQTKKNGDLWTKVERVQRVRVQDGEQIGSNEPYVPARKFLHMLHVSVHIYRHHANCFGTVTLTTIQYLKYGDDRMEDFLMEWQAAVREIGDMMSEEEQRQLLMSQLVLSVKNKIEIQALHKRPAVEQTQDAFLQLLRDAINQKQHQEMCATAVYLVITTCPAEKDYTISKC